MDNTILQLKSRRIHAHSILASEDVVAAAQELLGMYLVSAFNGELTAGKIVETEAYRAPEDKASHAFGHRRTARTEVMYGDSGVAYVYLCYGIHHLFNIITGPKETPHAVLIRGIEPIVGIDKMLQRRGMDQLRPQLTAGPGVLSKALGFHKSHTGQSIFSTESNIWLSEANNRDFKIVPSPRVGIDYAAEWVNKPWRFRIKGNPFCSKSR